METTPGPNQTSPGKFQLNKELIEILDRVSPSTEVLAAEVYEKLKDKLPDLDDYSLLCFCIEYIASMSLTKASYYTNEIKRLSFIHQYAHYLRIWEKWIPSVEDMKKANEKSGT